MRRMSAWAVMAAVLLALGIGVLVGRAVDDDEPEAASTRSVTSTSTSTSSTTSSSTSTTVASADGSTTTTVKVVTAAPQTASTTTPTTAAGAPATTAARPSNPACGSGTANASAKLVVTGEGPPANPVYKYSGPVTVANNTSKPIEVDTLVLRLSSSDGTNEEVPVSGAAGTVIAAGATHDFGFNHTTSHEPKAENAVTVSKFAYGPPGQTAVCGSI